MKRLLSTVFAATILVAPTLQAQGPAGTFGPLPEATFGGGGIPNNAVMVGGVDGAVLGMTAHQRFSSPALTNNGAGVFYAQTGESAPNLSLWNFGFYVGGANRGQYTYRLLYDMNPAAGNGGHGVIDDIALAFGFGYNASENLGFQYLGLSLPGITPPAYATFDPNANGRYTFALEQYSGDQRVSQVGMEVIVGSPVDVPEPASAALLLVGMAGLLVVRARSSASVRTR